MDISHVRKNYPQSFPKQEQDQPGLTGPMEPTPDHGETTYTGAARLSGKKALITGGDSGIGRAVALAFAREGASIALSYLPEEEQDAQELAELLTDEGTNCTLLPGDLTDEDTCRWVVAEARDKLGGLDTLVLNAAYQEARDGITAISTEEFDRVMRTNLYAPFWLTRAARPYLEPHSSIVVTTSIQAFQPSPQLLDYAMTKAALVAFVKALAQELGEDSIRINGIAPGPIWTPLIPATSWPEKLPDFGSDTPLGRAGQPAELAGAYVFLASDEASYISGAILPVTGGKGL